MLIINQILLSTLFSTIFWGVTSSFLASIFFTYLFTRLRPSIIISPHIAAKTRNGQVSYRIKVINKSWFDATNIRTGLSYLKFFPTPDGLQERMSTPIPNTDQELFIIERFNASSQFATYTFRFKTSEDIRHGLTLHKRTHIRFKISCTHSLSNLGGVFQKDYTVNDIIDGDFCFWEHNRNHPT